MIYQKEKQIMYEIIDNTGVLYSGSEDEMKLAYEVMTTTDLGCIDFESGNGRDWNDLQKKYPDKWYGDLKLVQVIKTTKQEKKLSSEEEIKVALEKLFKIKYTRVLSDNYDDEFLGFLKAEADDQYKYIDTLNQQWVWDISAELELLIKSENIKNIIEKKKRGDNCSKEELKEVKTLMMDHIDFDTLLREGMYYGRQNFQDVLMEEIKKLFPKELSEAIKKTEALR